MSTGDPRVELSIAGVWTDITSYVRTDPGITIVRGRQDEQSSPTAAQCSLTLDNADGRFSPKNASGAYYGYLDLGTLLRVSVKDAAGVYHVRFVGNVYEWPVAWAKGASDTARYASIVANGPRRRLARNQSVWPPYRRAELALGSALVGYWPMEDGALSSWLSSGLGGGAVAGFAGSVTLAADSSTFVASAALPTFGDGGTVVAVVPGYSPAASGQQVRCLVHSTSSTAGVAWEMIVDTNGAHFFRLHYVPVANTGQLTMENSATGAVEFTSGLFTMTGWNTGGVRLSIELKQNGTGIDANVVWLLPGHTSGNNFGVSTIPLATLGQITRVSTRHTGAGVSTVLGHLSVENQITSIFDLQAVLDGYAGELASDRAYRLAADEGVTADVVDLDATTEPVGVQGSGTFLELFDEAAFTDGGWSTELVDDYGLSWRGRSNMYSPAAALTLNYAAEDVQILAPTIDDQALVNDVTVTRTGGGSAMAVATGPLAPSVVGEYPDQVELNLFADDQCRGQADWRVNVGTATGPRFPVVGFDAVNGLSSGQVAGLVGLREGDVLALSGMDPASVGAASTRVRVLGWTETILVRRWLFALNTVQAAPFDVVVLGDATFGVLGANRLAL